MHVLCPLPHLILEVFYVPPCSPFAPLDDEAPPSPPAGDEDAPGLKAAGGDMTLVSQVVHPDCRPVLEFDMVRRLCA